MPPPNERYQMLINRIKSGSISTGELESAIEAADFENEQLHQIYLTAVTHMMSKKNLAIFSIIPESQLTHDICLAAVKANPISHYYFPKDELKNYEILLELVRNSGSDLEKVPPPMRDLNMCLTALGGNESNIFVLPFIPESLLKNDSVQAAITECRENIPKVGSLLSYLPLSLRDLDICIAAAKQTWQALQYVPETMLGDKGFSEAITKSREAIKHDWSAIKNIPLSLRDLDICIAAAKQNWKALQYVPETMLGHKGFSEAITGFHEAIKHDWKAIQIIPSSLITQEDCLAAFKGSHEGSETLDYIPVQFRNYKLINKAASDSFSTLYLPDYLNNYQTETALSKDECISIWFTMISYLGQLNLLPFEPPREILNFAFCKKVIKEKVHLSSRLLEYLQDYTNRSVLTKKQYGQIILAAIKTRKLENNLQYVPIEMRDYEICMESVRNNTSVLLEIRDYERKTVLSEDEFRSICLAATCKHSNAILIIPAKFVTSDFLIEAIENSMHGKEILYKLNSNKDDINLSPEEYLKIACAAVENNPMALEYVDEELRKPVIDELTPQKILSLNVDAAIFFPASPDYTTTLDRLLENVKHVVVTNDFSFDLDKEIRDVYLVYSNSPLRAGKTLHVTKDTLNDFLDKLKRNYPNSDRQINLVLLDHASTMSKTIAGIGADDITQLLKRHDIINRVTLLGCNTPLCQASCHPQLITITGAMR